MRLLLDTHILLWGLQDPVRVVTVPMAASARLMRLICVHIVQVYLCVSWSSWPGS